MNRFLYDEGRQNIKLENTNLVFDWETESGVNHVIAKPLHPAKASQKWKKNLIP